METMYLVTYFRHNKTTGGNSYKVELATNDLREAKKKYHALLGEFSDTETFDFVMCMITDTYGNKIDSAYDEEPKPQPEPTPEETVTE